jgi:hypothetical protein
VRGGEGGRKEDSKHREGKGIVNEEWDMKKTGGGMRMGTDTPVTKDMEGHVQKEMKNDLHIVCPMIGRKVRMRPVIVVVPLYSTKYSVSRDIPYINSVRMNFPVPKIQSVGKVGIFQYTIFSQ